MRQAFPDGVPDWSRPEPNRAAPLGTWLSYAGATPHHRVTPVPLRP